jgi:hypothetical protein
MALNEIDLNAQFNPRNRNLRCKYPRNLFLAAVQSVNENDPEYFCLLGIHLEQDSCTKEWKVLSLCRHRSYTADSTQRVCRGDILYEALAKFDFFFPFFLCQLKLDCPGRRHPRPPMEAAYGSLIGFGAWFSRRCNKNRNVTQRIG